MASRGKRKENGPRQKANNTDPLAGMPKGIEAYFDADYYRLAAEARTAGIDPLVHYLTVGEKQGVPPSSRFDPAYYGELYPDAKMGSKQGLLAHYVKYGRKEGRRPLPPSQDIDCPTNGIDPGKPTILLLIHDGSRTGAPILGWNLVTPLRRRHNIVAVLQAGGPIASAFDEVADVAIVLPDGASTTGAECMVLARKLVDAYAPAFIIANSVATRGLAVALERSGAPVVALVHEFASDYPPRGTLDELFRTVSRIIFPAEIVARAAWADSYYIRPRHYEVHPQGRSAIPRLGEATLALAHGTGAEAYLARLPADAFLVVGMGSVTYRKGVDVFLSAARNVARASTRKVMFAWIGHVPPGDKVYRNYLVQQIERSGITETVTFLDEVEDLAPLYGRGDAFFLSSRLDPLPNVAIDAAIEGLPIICFENAGGFAELLAASPETAALVVPHVDAAAAARVIVELAENPQRKAAASRAISALAARTFDMDDYVRFLEQTGGSAVAERQQLVRDRATLLETGAFNAYLYFGTRAATLSREQAVTHYLDAGRLVQPLQRPNTGLFIRRPREGFNPLIYAMGHPELAASHEDPLAHYLRTGQPEGPWIHRVIRPVNGPVRSGAVRVALHAHFHYPDLLEEFLQRLAVNATPVALYLTTTSDERRAEIEQTLARHERRDVEVITVPNRGRDIGPFLVEIMPRVLGRADIVGHLHGKRSQHVDAGTADNWRDFALQHLIGAVHPMMDTIVAEMAADPRLGLVFPEDPHLNGWDENLGIAETLAPRMGVDLPLPNHFDFPIGTMFWARPEALKPMLDLKLGWDDFPAEPLPIDGTILHTLERLLSFAAQVAGFGYATTYVRESTR